MNEDVNCKVVIKTPNIDSEFLFRTESALENFLNSKHYTIWGNALLDKGKNTIGSIEFIVKD